MNQLLICLKKWRLWLTLLLTLFSIFLSIIAIYLSMRSPIEIDFDAALLVSVATIISIPTAVLIGWQIVNVIKIEKMKKQTLNARDEVLQVTNKNLLSTFHGLADFFSIQFAKREEDVSPEEENTLYFGALTYRAMEIHCASILSELQLFQSAIRTMSIMVDDAIILKEHQVAEIKNILESVPTSYRIDEFLSILNHFQIDK